MQPLVTLYNTLLDLFFPPKCLTCRHPLGHGETYLCTPCLAGLPTTLHHLRGASNDISYRLYGRLPLGWVVSYLYFSKGTSVHQLVHAIKYYGQPQVATWLGRTYGQVLRKAGVSSHVDAIVPVPLHPTKYQQRGYNQSTYWAKGLATGLGVPCMPGWLIRKVAGVSQTTKGRAERLSSLAGTFAVPPGVDVRGKRIALADDLITTGATCTACGEALMQAGATTLHLITLAAAT